MIRGTRPLLNTARRVRALLTRINRARTHAAPHTQIVDEFPPLDPTALRRDKPIRSADRLRRPRTRLSTRLDLKPPAPKSP
jgi:hypothetical protein